ncbi:hypothetical protein LWI29_023111 [Acer saccharum]|uniref:C2H2-type domain-containing protein n=1 Tax=Acer saccharum TaxID=4024 RepID=A0AA39W8P9_ACESA|nr:hypothetical protein LWI29_023111 [Acer saccharum]
MKQVERLSPRQSQILQIGLARVAYDYSKSDDDIDIGDRQQQGTLLKGFLMNGMIIPLPLMKVEDVAGDLEKAFQKDVDAPNLHVAPLSSGASDDKLKKARHIKNTRDSALTADCGAVGMAGKSVVRGGSGVTGCSSCLRFYIPIARQLQHQKSAVHRSQMTIGGVAGPSVSSNGFVQGKRSESDDCSIEPVLEGLGKGKEIMTGIESVDSL